MKAQPLKSSRAGLYPDPPLMGSQYGGDHLAIMSLVCFICKIRTDENAWKDVLKDSMRESCVKIFYIICHLESRGHEG